jgi:hypothetical protein
MNSWQMPSKKTLITVLAAIVLSLPVLHGCSSTPPVTRIETRTVPKLEFVPVPDAATAPCLVPYPPVNDRGELPYDRLPEYTARVLGALEKCNIQLDAIRDLQPPGEKPNEG